MKTKRYTQEDYNNYTTSSIMICRYSKIIELMQECRNTAIQPVNTTTWNSTVSDITVCWMNRSCQRSSNLWLCIDIAMLKLQITWNYPDSVKYFP